MIKYHCHNCNSQDVDLFKEINRLFKVTSDARPSIKNLDIGFCNSCQLAQTLVTDKWKKEINNIYKNYDIYSQSNGKEQKIFSNNGVSDYRSDAILNNIGIRQFKNKGRLLDIGCGNGAFLKAFSKVFPNWELQGTELNKSNLAQLNNIKNFTQLHTTELSDISDKFDVISLIHVIEHIPDPKNFLKIVSNLLNPEGIIIIQVPYYINNPYILTIADHCSHFTKYTLSKIVNSSNFKIKNLTTKWVTKEISLIAQRCDENDCILENECKNEKNNFFDKLNGLLKLQKKLSKLKNKLDQFGIFGSSIAASWCYMETNKKAKFFVDEDVNRIGRKHLGLKIRSFGDINSNIPILAPIPEINQTDIINRVSIKYGHLDIIGI